MKFDKETIIGLALCMIVMLAWPTISQKMGWTPEETETVETSAAAEKQHTPAAVQTSAPAVTVPAEKTAAAEKTIDFKDVKGALLANESVKADISPTAGGINKIEFIKYQNNDLSKKITVDYAGFNSGIFALNIPGAKLVNAENAVIRDNTIQTSKTLDIGKGKIRVDQYFSFAGDYIINCRYLITNIGSTPVVIDKAVVNGGMLAPWHTFSGDKIRTMSHRMDILTADGDYEDITADDDDEDFFFVNAPQVLWAAVSNKYFCNVFKSTDGKPHTLYHSRTFIKDANDKDQPVVSIGNQLPLINLPDAGAIAAMEFSVYAGPKNAETLAAFAPEGERVLHLAWGPLNYLARFLMWILNLLYTLCGSYGFSIILLTLIVRTAFYPLTSRGNESMRKMQKVQPMFKELKEKYKNDPQLLNQKMAELYRKEGINPFAGCLPILLQIPIFFALYAMLDNAIALRHVSFLWSKNLAAADTIFSIPLGFTMPLLNVSAIPVNPLALAMTALMVIQQRMTPMSMDPAQRRMMNMMPIIMLIFLYDLPSGLTLYWTISNCFSIIQLWLQKRSRAQQTANGQGK